MKSQAQVSVCSQNHLGNNFCLAAIPRLIRVWKVNPSRPKNRSDFHLLMWQEIQAACCPVIIETCPVQTPCITVAWHMWMSHLHVFMSHLSSKSVGLFRFMEIAGDVNCFVWFPGICDKRNMTIRAHNGDKTFPSCCENAPEITEWFNKQCN